MTAKHSKARSSAKNPPGAKHVNLSASAALVDASPLSIAVLAKLAGVSRQYVHKVTRPGGPLAPALLPTGDVDGNHALVRAWLARSEAKDDDDDAEPDLDPLDGDDADLKSLVAKVAEWRALKLKSEAKLAARRDEVHAGRLISRDTVRTHVFGALEALHNRLLTDACNTMAHRARTASTLEEATATLREHISSQLTTARSQIVRGLRAARTGDTPPEMAEVDQQLAAVERVSPKVSDAFRAAMHAKAAPRVLDLILRSFARHAAGKPWTASIFDDAMTLRDPVERDVLSAVTHVLVEHAAAAICVADRALAYRPEPEEHAHAPT